MQILYVSENPKARDVESIKIVQAGDPVLRRVAAPLTRQEIGTARIQELIATMRDTMREAPGVGLAAPQIGESLQIAVVEVRAEQLARRGYTARELAEREMEPVAFHVLINPKLTVVDSTPRNFFEGCLSVSGYAAQVARAHAVRVSALDHDGAPVVILARGWHARILQHECDHLKGTLYVDRMDSRTFTTGENHERFSRPDPTE